MCANRNKIFTANPRPNPGESQSRVTFVGEWSYRYWLDTAQPNRLKMTTVKMAHVSLAMVARRTNLRSRNHPQKRSATVATSADSSEPRVRARTEKYLVR